MPQFEIVSIEKALEATRNDRWLSEKFGEEIDTIYGSETATCPECDGTNLNDDETLCWDCHASDYQG